MQIKEYKLFPKLVLVFDDQELKKTINVGGLIKDIDFILQNKTHVQKGEMYPANQTLPVFWKHDIKWWEEEYNTDWNVVKQSFESCCKKYLSYVYQNNSNYAFTTYSKAWALKGSQNQDENFIHNHAPATLSGILYLKNASNIGTEFHNYDYTKEKYTINANEMDWIIFPSNLYHRPASITDIDRYTLACDLHIGVY